MSNLQPRNNMEKASLGAFLAGFLLCIAAFFASGDAWFVAFMILAIAAVPLAMIAANRYKKGQSNSEVNSTEGRDGCCAGGKGWMIASWIFYAFMILGGISVFTMGSSPITLLVPFTLAWSFMIKYAALARSNTETGNDGGTTAAAVKPTDLETGGEVPQSSLTPNSSVTTVTESIKLDGSKTITTETIHPNGSKTVTVEEGVVPYPEMAASAPPLAEIVDEEMVSIPLAQDESGDAEMAMKLQRKEMMMSSSTRPPLSPPPLGEAKGYESSGEETA